MGGASSRFEQTQWWNADGELVPATASRRKIKEENDYQTTIIPGESATTSLQIFDIIKNNGITSQRDFEIRNGSQNAVYITRPVPGTMAYFDVLRPGRGNELNEEDELELKEDEENEDEEEKTEEEKEETTERRKSGWGDEITEDPTTFDQATPRTKGNDDEELLLRVHVDKKRRTWIVYSYTQVFPGQLPAMLPESDRVGLEEGLKLYKSCCITLSWSKYLAMAARYGPPTKLHDFLIDGDDDDETEHSEVTGDDHRNSDFIERIMFTKAETIAAKARDEEVNSTVKKIATSPKAETKVEEKKEADVEEGGGVIGNLLGLGKTLMGSKQGEQNPLTKKEKQMLSMEGVVNLDAPLLQCQQVLQAKANYQTRTIDKEEAVKLWMLDDAWRKAKQNTREEDDAELLDPIKNPLAKAMTYEKEQLQPSEDMDEMKKWFSDKYVDQDQMTLAQDDASTATSESLEIKEEEPKDMRRNLMMKGKSWFSYRMPKTTPSDPSNSSSSINEDGGSFSSIDDSKLDDGEADEPKNKVYGSQMGVATVQDDDPSRKEPLVAYWQWKNTYTKHKMQMHLAKNSDLALHAIMSIILNICRYEWH